MQRVSSGLSRSLIVLAVLFTLIAPSAQAAQIVDDPNPGTRIIQRVRQVVRHFLGSVLGDMISVPKP